MSEESVVSIVVPIVSGVLAVIGSFVGNYALSLKKSRENAIKEAEREQAEKDQLAMILEEQKEIKKRLDLHNGYAEKYAETTKNIALMAQKQEFLAESVSNLQTDINVIKSGYFKK